MGGGGPIVAIRASGHTHPVSNAFDLSSLPQRLIVRDLPALPQSRPRRSKIWELNSNLHCSVIGTCLSTNELRQVLKRLGNHVQGLTDHDLHGMGVTLAGRHDDGGRLINKAMDQRHKLVVSQFEKATDAAALRSLWEGSVKRGDIPGAYWATLTHSAATQEIVRAAFGQVHMLSHLVGSANRADIRRLCQIESEKAELEEKLEQRQAAFHDAVTTRDARIRDLRQALAERIVAPPAETPAETPSLIDLPRRLTAETARRALAEERLATAQAELARERAARAASERQRDELRQELDAIEATLGSGDIAAEPPGVRLDGIVLLYVGGRPHQIAAMRAAAGRLGATFLHHDGGMENHQNLLPGLTSRSDIVLFPVDCISHDAANLVKSLCRQTGKRFVPLRSASVTSLLVTLQRHLGPTSASD